VSAVNLPGKFLSILFLPVNYFLTKKMFGPHISNQMLSKIPIPNCKEVSLLSADNKYQYNNYYTYHILYFLDSVYK